MGQKASAANKEKKKQPGCLAFLRTFARRLGKKRRKLTTTSPAVHRSLSTRPDACLESQPASGDSHLPEDDIVNASMEVLLSVASCLEDDRVAVAEEPGSHDLPSRLAVLSVLDLAAMEVKELLGEGSFGRVERVCFRGEDVVRKSLKRVGHKAAFQWECRVLLEVDGAGGAPRLHAVCHCPPVAIQDYVGVTFMAYCSASRAVGTFLLTLEGVAQSLAEVHQRGFVHNDIKADNLAVSGTPSRPVVHVIDFGLATRIGHAFTFDFFGLAQDQQDFAFFRSPELKRGLPLQPSSDVFSVGMLMARVAARMQNPSLTRLIGPIMASCTKQQPGERPPLPALALCIRQLLKRLTLQQLAEPLGGEWK